MTLKKAKTNSNELASVTTRREAETEWRGKKENMEGLSGSEMKSKRNLAVVRIF